MRSPSIVAVASVSLLAIALTGCGDESPVAARGNIAGQFWSLRTDIHAATLAVGGTQQLVATPRTAVGDTLRSLPAPTFTSLDMSKVQVDPAGVIHGVAVTSSTKVITSLTVDGVTLADTTLVVVSAAPSTLKTFSIHPADRATLAIGSGRYLLATVTDVNDITLVGLAVEYRSLDTTIATFTSGYLVGKAKGSVRLAAATTSFGVTKTDTVTFTITNPTAVNVQMYGNAYPGLPALSTVNAIIGLNGSVTWYNYGSAASSITFDNGGTNVTGGNAPSVALYGSVTRQFPVAGKYRYQDALGNVGSVVVLSE